jgi:hypothetical protein
MFNIGDRVYYISGSYTLGRSNPLKGSSYECQGTVVHSDGFITRVLWDNGISNSYFGNNLELVFRLNRTDPNTQWAEHKTRR